MHSSYGLLALGSSRQRSTKGIPTSSWDGGNLAEGRAAGLDAKL